MDSGEKNPFPSRGVAGLPGNEESFDKKQVKHKTQNTNSRLFFVKKNWWWIFWDFFNFLNVNFFLSVSRSVLQTECTMIMDMVDKMSFFFC